MIFKHKIATLFQFGTRLPLYISFLGRVSIEDSNSSGIHHISSAFNSF